MVVARLALFSVEIGGLTTPSPASMTDGLLISAIICASTVSPDRWSGLLLLPALGFLPLLVLSHRNLGLLTRLLDLINAYLFGLFFSIVTIWLFEKLQDLGCFWLQAHFHYFFSFLWQTGSRAALVSALVSCLVVFVLVR